MVLKLLPLNSYETMESAHLLLSLSSFLQLTSRKICKILQRSYDDSLSLDYNIDNFLQTYRSTPHATTGESPAKLLFCWDLKTYGVPLVPILYYIHYMYMWTYIYICRPTFIYVGLHLYMRAYKYMCGHTFIYVCLHLYM